MFCKKSGSECSAVCIYSFSRTTGLPQDVFLSPALSVPHPLNSLNLTKKKILFITTSSPLISKRSV